MVYAAPVDGGGLLHVRIDVGVDTDADAAELDDAVRGLRGELLELDVEDVERPSGGSAPEGARGPEVALLGTLMVSAGRAGVSALVKTVAGWIGRRPGRSVTLQIGDDSIELTDASAEDQQRLIEAFVARHSAA